MKTSIVLCALISLLPLFFCQSAEAKKDWSVIPQTISPETKADMESFSPEDFNLTLSPSAANDSKCGAQVVRTVDAPRHAQGKLFFRARVPGGESVQIYLIFTTKEDGKVVTKWGPKLTVSGRNFAQYTFALDSDFGLLDKDYHIWQIKPWISLNGVRAGHPVTVEIRDFQMDLAENIGKGTEKPDVTVYPPERPEIRPDANAMRIYFHFDNEDLKPVSLNGLSDPLPYPGFREMLISAVKKNALLADSPETADVIVYSSAKKAPVMAARIVRAVEKGTPLYAASAIADPEIMAIMPVEEKPMSSKGFPKREKLKAADQNDPIFKGLSQNTFGVYHDLSLKKDAKLRLSYADGTPVMVEGLSGKGRVVYMALGIGVDLIPGKNSYDPLLLRTLAELTGKKIPEEARPSALKENGWQLGASEENIGRVGFMLGDGLLCESMNNGLSVGNGSGQYEFRKNSLPKLRIGKWHIRSISGSPAESEKDIDWNYMYGQIGTVELTASALIPENWKNAPLRFQVEGGIDDTAQVYFNGNLIGEVTLDMPQYWCRPHRYVIAREQIKYGEVNEIRIVTQNVRGSGGFGSCPEIVPAISEKSVLDVKIDRANPLGKGAVVSGRENSIQGRFDTSLAFPGVRWDFQSENIHMALSNIASYAAVFRKGAVEIFDLAKTDSIPCDWDKPAILLFPKDNGSPLLLVFSKKLDRITVEHFGNEVGGISIEHKSGIGMIVPLWLYGKAQVKTDSWEKILPEETLNRINFWLPKSFAYPVSYKEMFKIDEKAKLVRIRSIYSFKDTANDWSMKPEHYAPVSPLLYFMKGMLFEGEGVENWNLATSFGYYAARPGTDTVEWTLPLPEDSLNLVPHLSGQNRIDAQCDDVFRKASEFIGGRRNIRTANFEHTFKPDRPEQNICLHMWLQGTSDIVASPFSLSPENRSILEERLSYRFFLPLEQYAYKSAVAWREEPFSGIRYPLCYNSPRMHHSKFAPGKGSNFNFADSNETVYMITTTARALADQHGQIELIRANETWFRYFTKLLFVGDDWITLTGHCGESGMSASIDMLNCEYPGMLKVARIAEIIGDKDWQDQCLYRAARRSVATLARLSFKHYYKEAGLAFFKPGQVYGTGYSEDGYDYKFGNVYKNTSYHLYDMSQGIPQELFPLYDKYAKKETDEYIKSFVLPHLYNDKGEFIHDHKLLNVLSHSDIISKEDKLKAMKKCLENAELIKFLSSDYVGMTLSSNIAMSLDQIYGKVRVKNSKDIKIESIEFNPDSKEFFMKIQTGKKPELILSSSTEIDSQEFKRDSEGLIRIPLKPDSSAEIRLKVK